MEKLNNKIKNGRSEKIDDAQMVGNYAYDSTVDKLRRLTCDTNGALHVDVHGGSAGSGDLKCRTNIADPSTSTFVKCNADGTLEMTAELSSAGLATSANQDTVINATVRDINNTDSVGDGSANATAVALGYDRSGGKGRAVLVNSAGELMVNLGSATTQNVNCLGNEEGDGSGAVKHLHLDGSGNVQTNIVNTVNVAPANSVNSHITDDPANSVAVGLKARTTIGTATTEQFLLCDSDGHLQVDIVSGGGGGSSNTNLYPTLASITTATNFAGSPIKSNYVDLTNAKNIVINCIHTGNATARANFSSDIALTVEFTDDDTNTVCYSGASSPVFATATLDAKGDSTGSAVAVLSFGENSEASGQITGKFCRVVAVNNDVSGTGTAFAIDFKVVISGI